MKKLRRNAGVTLVELIVTIAILAVICVPIAGIIVTTSRDYAGGIAVSQAKELCSLALEKVRAQLTFAEGASLISAAPDELPENNHAYTCENGRLLYDGEPAIEETHYHNFLLELEFTADGASLRVAATVTRAGETLYTTEAGISLLNLAERGGSIGGGSPNRGVQFTAAGS